MSSKPNRASRSRWATTSSSLSPRCSRSSMDRSPARFPIESAGDIGDDFSVRVDGPQVRDLSVEVCSLLAGTDSAIADGDGFGDPVQVSVNVVQSLTCGVAVIGDFALGCISSQCLRMQPQCCGSFAAGDVHHERTMGHCRTLINIIGSGKEPFGVAAQREYYGVQTAIHVSKRCKTLFAAPIARDGYRIVPIEPHNVFEVASVFGDVRQPLAFVPLVSHISSFSTG